MHCPFAQTNPPLHRSGFPDAPFPDPSLYEKLGFDTIATAIRYQHQLLWVSDSQKHYGDDPVHFAKTVEYTVNYFVEMLGGPKLFTPVRGQPKLGMRHKHFNLTPKDRETWLDCMYQALKKEAVPPELAQPIWDWIEPLSMRFLRPRVELQDLKRVSINWNQEYD